MMCCLGQTRTKRINVDTAAVSEDSCRKSLDLGKEYAKNVIKSSHAVSSISTAIVLQLRVTHEEVSAPETYIYTSI